MTSKKGLFLMQLPPPWHGASVANKNLVSFLSNQNIECSVVNISLAADNGDIGQIRFKKIFSFLQLIFQVLIASLRSDYVYITLSPHGSAFVKDSFLLTLCKIFIRKRYVHFHGKGVRQFVESRKLLTWYYRNLLKGCELIHLDKVLYKDLDCVAPNINRHVLVNGVVDEFSECDQLVLESTRDIDFLYLSNMIVSKGWKHLLKSLDDPSVKEKKFRIVFAGNFENKTDRVYFDRYVEEHDLKNVEYIGPVFGQRKSELLLKSKIFVLPTFYRNECSPLSIIEAMSAGCHILSTYEGAIPSLVKPEFSVLIENVEVDLVRDALLDSIAKWNDTRSKSTSQSRQYFLEKFTLNSHLEAFRAIVKEL